MQCFNDGVNDMAQELYVMALMELSNSTMELRVDK